MGDAEKIIGQVQAAMPYMAQMYEQIKSMLQPMLEIIGAKITSANKIIYKKAENKIIWGMELQFEDQYKAERFIDMLLGTMKQPAAKELAPETAEISDQGEINTTEQGGENNE